MRHLSLSYLCLLMVGLLLLTYDDSRSEETKTNICIEHICYADIGKMTLVERPEVAADGVALRADQRLSSAVHRIQ